MVITIESLGFEKTNMMYDTEIFARYVGLGVDKKLYARVDLNDNTPSKFIVEDFERVYIYNTIEEAITKYNDI